MIEDELAGANGRERFGAGSTQNPFIIGSDEATPQVLISTS